MPPQRVLVTGANGHLGRRLLTHLATGRGADGDAAPELCALVRSERAAAVLRALPAAARPAIHVVDYLDADAVLGALEGCDAVAHLVGILKESSTSRYEVAHEGTCRVLAAAAAKAGVARIVYLSILGSDPAHPNACLASKGRAEEILQRSGVPTTVLQVPMVLGPGEIAALALRGRARAPFVFATGGGASLEQPIDADDVARAIVAALADRSGASVTHQLAGPEVLSARDLLARAAARLGTSPRVIPVPRFLVHAAARLLAAVTLDPPMTPAMLGVLEHDDAIDPGPACRALGLELTPLDETLRRALEAET